MASGVDMVGIRAELAGGRTPLDCWRYFARTRIEPLSVQRSGHEPAAVTRWFVDALAAISLGAEVFVAPSGVGFLPWFVFRLPDGPDGLARYYRSLTIRSLLVSDGYQCLSFHTGEHTRTATVFDLAAVVVSESPDAEPGNVTDSTS